MKILRSKDEFFKFISSSNCDVGCFADTGFLYGLAYSDDRLFDSANDTHDALVEYEIPIYANVISRMELIDLVFRKQVTLGCLKLFENIKSPANGKPIYAILKDIRDKNTAAKNRNESYKIDETRLKKLRKNIDVTCGMNDWTDFCRKYVGSMLVNEWQTLEEELGLNFIEVMDGQISPLFNHPLTWKDMVEVMGNYGQRGPDAMIVNLFLKSKFPLLITTDSDLESCFDESPMGDDKAIYFL